MTYDFDGVIDRSPPQLPPMPPPNPRDLEVIMTMLALAAIELTPEPGRTFTFEQLMDAAHSCGCGLLERDVRIVLPYVKFLKKHSGGRFSLK